MIIKGEISGVGVASDTYRTLLSIHTLRPSTMGRHRVAQTHLSSRQEGEEEDLEKSSLRPSSWKMRKRTTCIMRSCFIELVLEARGQWEELLLCWSRQ